MGRFLVNTTPTATSTVSSNGIHDTTANATVNAFTAGAGLTGLSLTPASTLFDGATATKSATYTLGGTRTATGDVTGSFTATVTAEFGSISNVAIPVTGTAVGVRTVTAPTAVTLPSNLLSGATVSIPYAATGGTYGGGTGVTADTENATLTLPGSPSNGLNLTGSTSVTTAGNVLTLSGKVVGNGAVSGNLSVGVSRELSGAQTAITYAYSGNVGSATIGGPALTAAVALGTTYGNLSATVTGSHATTASIVAGTNSTGSAETVSMAFRAPTTGEGTYPNTTSLFSTTPNALFSDVVNLSGMNGPSAGVTDVFALQLSYDQTAVTAAGINEAQLQVAWLNGSGTWVPAPVQNTPTSALPAYLGSYAAFASAFNVTEATLGNYLGYHGVDTVGNTAWAILNHNSEFAVDLGPAAAIPEPTTWAAGSLLALGFAAAGLRKRRKQLAA
ncbi:MAG: hypothetical protein QM811_23435 [Pirellulales bacterium]